MKLFGGTVGNMELIANTPIQKSTQWLATLVAGTAVMSGLLDIGE